VAVRMGNGELPRQEDTFTLENQDEKLVFHDFLRTTFFYRYSFLKRPPECIGCLGCKSHELFMAPPWSSSSVLNYILLQPVF